MTDRTQLLKPAENVKPRSPQRDLHRQTQHDSSQLKKEVFRSGKGPVARFGDLVDVQYVGTLMYSGRMFDRAASFQFRLGAGEVIKGWDEGLQGMQEGEMIRLTIPPELAYGARSAPPKIPPQATLCFDLVCNQIHSSANIPNTTPKTGAADAQQQGPTVSAAPPAAAPPAFDTLHAPTVFMKADSFAGAKQGMVFTMGTQGLGYYPDVHSMQMPSGLAGPPADVLLSGRSQTACLTQPHIVDGIISNPNMQHVHLGQFAPPSSLFKTPASCVHGDEQIRQQPAARVGADAARVQSRNAAMDLHRIRMGQSHNDFFVRVPTQRPALDQSATRPNLPGHSARSAISFGYTPSAAASDVNSMAKAHAQGCSAASAYMSRRRALPPGFMF